MPARWASNLFADNPKMFPFLHALLYYHIFYYKSHKSAFMLHSTGSAMHQVSQHTPKLTPKQIPCTLRLSAAERLVATSDRKDAAKKLVASAPAHGIDLDLMWGIVDPDTQDPDTQQAATKNHPWVRQVALAVVGSGKTAMLFHSNPDNLSSLGSTQTQTQEIADSIKAAITGLSAYSPDRVTLAQSLIETNMDWAVQACTQAGMICVGTLDYMRMPINSKFPNSNPAIKQTNDWPAGITVRTMTSIHPSAPNSDYNNLIQALEGSYIDTLDCPELCGLRSMEDVVESHKATGDFNPQHWHLIFKDGAPAGCCLLTHIPQSNSVELVYLGLSPPVRGLGLGRTVLSHAIAQLDIPQLREVSCAVDDRNTPAINIYKSLGFERFDARVGFVVPIAPNN